MAERTQATTTEAKNDEKTITLAYTRFDLERGTDDEIAAYELRSAEATPDDFEPSTLETVYDERVEISVPADAFDEHGTVEVLESMYKAIELDDVDEIDRTEYRSPMIGDVFVVDGTAYVVSRIGFEPIETSGVFFETRE